MKEEVIIGEITRLIVHNEEFSMLYNSMNAFNPLKILDVYEQEKNQLKTISWLLNPKGNHRLGDHFLKAFINDVLLINEENQSVLPLSQIKTHLSNYNDTTVTNDWKMARKMKTVDIVIHSPMNKLVIVVLYKKVNDNLNYHMEEILSMIEENREYENCNILPVYLTETGEEPPNKKFCSITFENILSLLEDTVNNYEKELNESVILFIKYYKDLIKETLFPTKMQVKLCQSIYRDHKEIINWLLHEDNSLKSTNLKAIYNEINDKYGEVLKFILEQGKEDPFIVAMSTFLNDKVDVSLSATRLKNTEQWFYPIHFMNIQNMQQAVLPSWHSPYPISYCFKKEQESLKLMLEVGPFKEPSQRLAFLHHIKDNSSFTFSDKALRIESVSSCLKVESVPFEEWEWNKDEIISTRMNHLYKYKFSDVNKLVVDLIQSFDWSIK